MWLPTQVAAPLNQVLIRLRTKNVAGLQLLVYGESKIVLLHEFDTVWYSTSVNNNQ